MIYLKVYLILYDVNFFFNTRNKQVDRDELYLQLKVECKP